MSAAAEEARQGFGMAAPGQLPAGLDAETPTKKGAAKKRKAEVAQVLAGAAGRRRRLSLGGLLPAQPAAYIFACQAQRTAFRPLHWSIFTTCCACPFAARSPAGGRCGSTAS